MLTLSWIGVRVQVGAIKKIQPRAVFGEMGRHPIKQHANIVLMALVDEIHQVCRGAKTTGRTIKAQYLISPRSIQRMLGYRHQLNVGKAHFHNIGNQLVGQLAIGQVTRSPLFIGFFAPGTEMYFVDRNRLIKELMLGAVAHPIIITPLVTIKVNHHRSCFGALLHRETVGIGFIKAIAVFGHKTIFIDCILF